MNELRLDTERDARAATIRSLLTQAAWPDGIMYITEGTGPDKQRVGILIRLPARPVIQEEHGSYGVVR